MRVEMHVQTVRSKLLHIVQNVADVVRKLERCETLDAHLDQRFFSRAHDARHMAHAAHTEGTS